jgi:hypothetical protein
VKTLQPAMYYASVVVNLFNETFLPEYIAWSKTCKVIFLLQFRPELCRIGTRNVGDGGGDADGGGHGGGVAHVTKRRVIESSSFQLSIGTIGSSSGN